MCSCVDGNYLSILVTIGSLIISICMLAHAKWSASKEFLANVDNDEMRKARKIVYDYINSNGKIEEIGNYKYKKLKPKEKKKMEHVEEALTKVIAFYDGNAVLMLKHHIPKRLFDGTTLITAVRFYYRVLPYIQERRTNKQRDDYNKIYAQYYSQILLHWFINIQMNRILKKINNNSYDKKFYKTNGNVHFLCKTFEK